MATVSKSFTAVGVSEHLFVRHLDKFLFNVSGTFDATWVLEKSEHLQGWDLVASGTGAQTNVPIAVDSPGAKAVYFRVRCSVFTSGTMVTSMADTQRSVLPPYQLKDPNGDVVMEIVEGGVKFPGTMETVGTASIGGGLARASQQIFIQAAGLAKVGGTSGWAVAPADNTSLVTLPQSQTASTLIIPIPRLKVGDTITAFSVVGQIESAGGAVTLDAELRKMTAAAADVADASVDSITQVAATADAIVSASKTLGTPEVVAADESFYVILTGTTAASTDIAIQGITLTITEA